MYMCMSQQGASHEIIVTVEGHLIIVDGEDCYIMWI